MTGVVVQHRLSFVVRFRDHFSGAPVATTLPVRLAGLAGGPLDGPLGPRQLDGSYRFLDVAPGAHRLLWREPFERSAFGWVRWSDADPEITVPRADPLMPMEFDLWLDPSAALAAGATAVRGKLVGADADGLTVRCAHTGVANDRFAVTDAQGEFVFPLPGALPPQADGTLPLRLSATAPDGTPRQIIPQGGGPAQPEYTFTLRPRAVARVLIQLA